MAGTMTWVGLDVHARSTHAAAVDVNDRRAIEDAVRAGSGRAGRLAGFRCRGRCGACYEAGPTGYGLYRAAVAAGVRIDVVAPGKTPRGPSDRGQDRSPDAGAARAVSVGRVVEGGHGLAGGGSRPRGELTRAHDACRRDLMNARHRVSKMLCAHGGCIRRTTRGARSTAGGSAVSSLSRT